ncbi:hypothetical protein FA95DRAFT_1578012 [Auriscalpium vulgare]|uniref:Uncharacterized protein n=1 Tax=Auriscalpium vulgare TaxID=40419 RepID=A0ACB8R4F7_9AGAM|nr:hypothetical protein FA95DRAFT_1578012 [Auriscalpium vulgare]
MTASNDVEFEKLVQGLEVVTGEEEEVLDDRIQEYINGSPEERSAIVADVQAHFESSLPSDKSAAQMKAMRRAVRTKVLTFYAANGRIRDPKPVFRSAAWNLRSIVMEVHRDDIRAAAQKTTAAIPGDDEYLAHYQPAVNAVLAELSPAKREEYTKLAEVRNKRGLEPEVQIKFVSGFTVAGIAANGRHRERRKMPRMVDEFTQAAYERMGARTFVVLMYRDTDGMPKSVFYDHNSKFGGKKLQAVLPGYMDQPLQEILEEYSKECFPGSEDAKEEEGLPLDSDGLPQIPPLEKTFAGDRDKIIRRIFNCYWTLSMRSKRTPWKKLLQEPETYMHRDSYPPDFVWADPTYLGEARQKALLEHWAQRRRDGLPAVVFVNPERVVPGIDTGDSEKAPATRVRKKKGRKVPDSVLKAADRKSQREGRGIMPGRPGKSSRRPIPNGGSGVMATSSAQPARPAYDVNAPAEALTPEDRKRYLIKLATQSSTAEVLLMSIINAMAAVPKPKPRRVGMSPDVNQPRGFPPWSQWSFKGYSLPDDMHSSDLDDLWALLGRFPWRNPDGSVTSRLAVEQTLLACGQALRDMHTADIDELEPGPVNQSHIDLMVGFLNALLADLKTLQPSSGSGIDGDRARPVAPSRGSDHGAGIAEGNCSGDDCGQSADIRSAGDCGSGCKGGGSGGAGGGNADESGSSPEDSDERSGSEDKPNEDSSREDSDEASGSDEDEQTGEGGCSEDSGESGVEDDREESVGGSGAREDSESSAEANREGSSVEDKPEVSGSDAREEDSEESGIEDNLEEDVGGSSAREDSESVSEEDREGSGMDKPEVSGSGAREEDSEESSTGDSPEESSVEDNPEVGYVGGSGPREDSDEGRDIGGSGAREDSESSAEDNREGGGIEDKPEVSGSGAREEDSEESSTGDSPEESSVEDNPEVGDVGGSGPREDSDEGRDIGGSGAREDSDEGSSPGEDNPNKRTGAGGSVHDVHKDARDGSGSGAGDSCKSGLDGFNPRNGHSRDEPPGNFGKKSRRSGQRDAKSDQQPSKKDGARRKAPETGLAVQPKPRRRRTEGISEDNITHAPRTRRPTARAQAGWKKRFQNHDLEDLSKNGAVWQWATEGFVLDIDIPTNPT